MISCLIVSQNGSSTDDTVPLRLRVLNLESPISLFRKKKKEKESHIKNEYFILLIKFTFDRKIKRNTSP